MKYKKKIHDKIKCKAPSAKAVMEQMLSHELPQFQILIRKIIEAIKDAGLASTAVKGYVSDLMKSEDLKLDLCSKLAPYQSAKLESIEVKSQVEHRMVMRAPARIESVSDWAKITGAEIGEVNKVIEKKKIMPPAPSIHDFDSEEDERLTQEELNKFN